MYSEMATIHTSTSDVNRHGIIHRLDQTSLRLCAQLLDVNEIISFGHTCHTLYATLNHPLTWTYVEPKVIELSRSIPSAASQTPFFQYRPCIWWIRPVDVRPSEIDDAVSRLSQRTYRLVGLSIEVSNVSASRTAVANRLVESLLNDARITNHLSWIMMDGYYYSPNLLSPIVQLTQLRTLQIVPHVPITKRLATQLAQADQLAVLEMCCSFGSESHFLPILAATSSGLIHSLTSLTLPELSYDYSIDFDCFLNFSQLRVLKLGCWKYFINKNILVSLSRVHSLRHLHFVVDPKWSAYRLSNLADDINATIPQLATCLIEVQDTLPINIQFYIPASPETLALIFYKLRHHGL